MSIARTVRTLAILGLLGSVSPASAADVSLFASNAINVILDELVPQFERASGHTVRMRLDYASVLRKEIESGAPFDVAILVGSLDALVKDQRIAANTPVALGRTGYGLAVRTGASKPDIGTSETFKCTLLNAQSVAYSKDGGSGAYFLRLIHRLGIAQAMQPKLRPGAHTQDAVASGEAEMTVNGIVPILRARGIELVGPLPDALQSYSTFVAGISAETKGPEAATALLRFLSSPTAAAVLKRRGLEPVPTTEK